MPSALGSPRALAYLALICTTALWGSIGVVSRALMDTIPPVVMAAARWGVAFTVLLPLVWPERREILQAMRRDWKRLLFLTVVGGAPQSALVYTGLAASTAIHLGLLNSTIPLTGVVLILAHGDLRALLHLQFNAGDLLMLGAMVVWAVYTLGLQDRPRSLSLFAFVFVMALMGELLTLPFAALQWVQAGGVNLGTRELLGLVYIGAFATLVSTALFGYGVERVGAVRAGILIHLMPVFSAVFAALFIGERLFVYDVLGFVLVAGGAILGCLKAEPVLSSQAPTKT